LLDRAAGYGFAGHSVDGTNLGECLEVVGTAVERARAGRGPQLVVAQLLRLCGHGEHDDSSYIDPGLRSAPVGRDCLKLAEQCLAEQQWADATTLAKWRGEIVQQVEDAVLTVQREPTPDPFREDWRAIATEHLVEGGELKVAG